MPEEFSTLLSDIAQAAGGAAQQFGPDAARRRGHERTVRRRAVASVLSVALLGAVGGFGAEIARHHTGNGAVVMNTGTPAPGVTPTSAPASSAPGSPSPSASSSLTTPTSAPGHTTVTGDVHTIVTSAWTFPNHFPLANLGWKPEMTTPGISTVDRQWFYSCVSSGTLAHLGAVGYQEITYSASGLPGFPGDQVLFFFPSTTAAHAALNTVQNDYAHCPEQTIGLDNKPMTGTVTQTAKSIDGYAWLHTYRNAQGQPGEPEDIPSDNHEFFVQRGNVLELVWFGGTPVVDDSSGDLGFLGAIEADLCVYGGVC